MRTIGENRSPHLPYFCGDDVYVCVRARKILIKEDVPGLLVGLGFVLVLWGGLAYGGLNPPPAGF